jgi:hypothetical protein
MAVGLPLKTTYANGDVYSASDVNDTNGTINHAKLSHLQQHQYQDMRELISYAGRRHQAEHLQTNSNSV